MVPPRLYRHTGSSPWNVRNVPSSGTSATFATSTHLAMSAQPAVERPVRGPGRAVALAEAGRGGALERLERPSGHRHLDAERFARREHRPQILPHPVDVEPPRRGVLSFERGCDDRAAGLE